MSSQGGPADSGPQTSNGIWNDNSKIVIGIDIGTTQSGVAFTYLIKGSKPQIHRISNWPGQTKENGNSKIPTVIWYENGKAISFGAEALSRDKQWEADDNGWVLAENFKLHLQPAHLRAKNLKLNPLNEKLPPLRQIYSDFMGYLFEQTKTKFQERILDGKFIWEKYMPTMEVIIGHPNGWGAQEQAFLRNAAGECGVFKTPQSTIAKNIKFVTEAEASVHYCIQHTNLSTQLGIGAIFAICDAGGSTVDTTLYSVTSTQPDLQLKEVRDSACEQAGGIFVNKGLEARLSKWMKDLGLEQDVVDEYTKSGVEDFESHAKRSFDFGTAGGDDTFSVKVAGERTRHGKSSDTYRIQRGGCIQVPGTDIQKCFDVCTNPIISSVDTQLKGSTVGHVLLVGGFGDSPYLRSVFKRNYEKQEIQVTLANESTSKAVADGAVLRSITRSVIARAPHYSFGVICTRVCLPWAEKLNGRDFALGPGGIPVVSGVWSPIVQKGIPLDFDTIYRETYTYTSEIDEPESTTLSKDLYAYDGDDTPKWAWDTVEPKRADSWHSAHGDSAPQTKSAHNVRILPSIRIPYADYPHIWVPLWDVNGDLLPRFHKVGTIEGKMSKLLAIVKGALEKTEGLLEGLDFWKMNVDVCFQFGGTELNAWVEWKQNGNTRTSPAFLVLWDPTSASASA